LTGKSSFYLADLRTAVLGKYILIITSLRSFKKPVSTNRGTD